MSHPRPSSSTPSDKTTEEVDSTLNILFKDFEDVLFEGPGALNTTLLNDITNAIKEFKKTKNAEELLEELNEIAIEYNFPDKLKNNMMNSVNKFLKNLEEKRNIIVSPAPPLSCKELLNADSLDKIDQMLKEDKYKNLPSEPVKYDKKNPKEGIEASFASEGQPNCKVHWQSNGAISCSDFTNKTAMFAIFDSVKAMGGNGFDLSKITGKEGDRQQSLILDQYKAWAELSSENRLSFTGLIDPKQTDHLKNIEKELNQKAATSELTSSTSSNPKPPGT